MDTEIQQAADDPITAFCKCGVARHSAHWPLEESALARDFIEFFAPGAMPTFQELTVLCTRLSIEVSTLQLSTGHSGLNCCYGEKRAIIISDAELLGWTKEHTLLHELREILEYEFRELGHPIAVKGDLEQRAELFAASVRMETAMDFWSELFKSASNVRVTWQRVVAYVLLAVGTPMHLFSIMAPCFDYLASVRSTDRNYREKKIHLLLQR